MDTIELKSTPYHIMEIRELNELQSKIDEFKSLTNRSVNFDIRRVAAEFAKIAYNFEAFHEVIHKYSRLNIFQDFALCASNFSSLLTSHHAGLVNDPKKRFLDHVSEDWSRAPAPPLHSQEVKRDVRQPPPKSPPSEANSLPYTLILLELKKVPANPYNGEPHEFNPWYHKLLSKIRRLKIVAPDAIEVLRAHTIGEPQELIDTFASNFEATPETQLDTIQKELKRRYGSSRHVAETLYGTLKDFPSIEGNDSSITPQLRKFSDACLLVSFQIEHCPDLWFLNTNLGLDPVRRKLPGYLIREWRGIRRDYMDANSEDHPPFFVFCNFIKKEVDELDQDCDSKNSEPKDYNTPSCGKVLITAEGRNNSTCVMHPDSSHESALCSYRYKTATGAEKKKISFPK